MLNASIRQLRAFVAVAQHLNFARAAEELCVTPPAVTQQIKELEVQVGMPLFDRTGRHVTLTVAGEYCLVYAKRVLDTLKEADAMIARFREVRAGRVLVGAVNTAEYFLPQLLVRFGQRYPDVEIKLSVDSRHHLLQQLADHEIDLAVMGRPPRVADVRAEPFARNPLGFVVPPDHPLLSRLGQPEPKQLSGAHIATRDRESGTRGALDEWCTEHRISPHIVLEAWSNELIKEAVSAGMGIGFLSLHTVGRELNFDLLRVLPVAHTPLMRRWHCVTPQSRPVSQITETFRYFLLEEGEAILAERYASVWSALQPFMPDDGRH